MELKIPEEYCDLLTAYGSGKDTMLNVIGTIVDILPLTTTKTGDFMLTLKLLDPWLRDNAHGRPNFRLRFFAPKKEHIPAACRIGDVLLVRQCKSSPFYGEPMVVSNYRTQWLLFVSGQIPDPGYLIAVAGKNRIRALARPDATAYEPTFEEQKYIIFLKQELSIHITELLALEGTNKRFFDPAVDIPTESRDAKMVKISNFGSKFRPIKLLQTGTFADLCVMVVKKFHIDTYRKTELYVTDYTPNDKLFYYTPPEELAEHEREGDHFGYSVGSKRLWRGPFGHMVLKVTAREPHSTFANLWGEEDKILVLRNVKMKAMNDFSNLEGDMWPDDKNERKNNVRRLQPNEHDWDEVHGLLERKEKYERYRKSVEKKHSGAANVSNDASNHAQATKSTKKSKKAAKVEARKNKEKDEEKAQTSKQQQHQDDKSSDVRSRAVVTREAAVGGVIPSGKLELTVGSTNSLWQVNKNIRANFPDVPTTGLLDILDLQRHRHNMKDGRGGIITIPFTNIRARTVVRVVDFLPSLDKFAIPVARSTDLGRVHRAEEPEESGYEWRFKLQLEDASQGADGKSVKGPDGSPVRFTVEVFHMEAQYLLGNNTPDPVDLATNPRLLAQLREKMCILWGNLEEWKLSGWTLKGGLKNKPFVCCIAEYGVEAKEGDVGADLGMKKCFKLTDTTIMLG